MSFLKRTFKLPIFEIAQRFPYLLVVSLMASIYYTLIILKHIENSSYNFQFVAVLIGGYVLGLAESVWRRHRLAPMHLIFVVIILFHLGYAFLAVDLVDAWSIWRFVIALAIGHLIYAASLWGIARNNEAYWKTNVVHLLRYLGTTLLSGLITGSIILILYLIDYLFFEGQCVSEKMVGVVAIWAFFFYHPLYFASGLLKTNAFVDHVIDDRLFKNVISYVFVPLMCTYMFIMLIYFIKTAFQWEWPEGGVSYWIAGLSVPGTLIYLLGYPYLRNGSSGLNKIFYRYYFYFLIPILVILFAAVYTRVAAYGITENRYLVSAAGLWLAGMSLYFIISKHKRLVVIPATLAIILFISIIGPWSAYAVSIRSQSNELKDLFTTAGLLTENGLEKSVRAGDAELENRMINIMRYLERRDALMPLIARLDTEVYDEIRHHKYSKSHALQDELGIKFSRLNARSFRLYIESKTSIQTIQLEEFDRVQHLGRYDNNIEWPDDSIKIDIKKQATELLNQNYTDAPMSKRIDTCFEGLTADIQYSLCCTYCIFYRNNEIGEDKINGILFYRNIEQ